MFIPASNKLINPSTLQQEGPNVQVILVFRSVGSFSFRILRSLYALLGYYYVKDNKDDIKKLSLRDISNSSCHSCGLRRLQGPYLYAIYKYTRYTGIAYKIHNWFGSDFSLFLLSFVGEIR